MASTLNASTSGGGGIIATADASGVMGLQTAGTTAVTIDASQNVGIGTSSPAEKLRVQNTTGVNSTFTNNVDAGLKINLTSGVSLISPSTGTLALGTSNTERMRIDSSGKVLIASASNWNNSIFEVNYGATGNQVVAFANSAATSPYGIIMKYTGATPNGTSNEFLYCNDSTALRMSVRSNGGIGNFSANNVNLSDARYKTDITPAKSYLDTICAIPVVTFKYKDQTDEELNLGVIAQDVDAVAPELVDHSGFGEAPEGEDPYLAIYQTDLQYALMKCIQEQQELIKQLQADVAALKGAK